MSITVKWMMAILAVMVLGLSLLGTASYEVITKHYRQYAESELIARSQSYADILSADFDRKTLRHVVGMKGPRGNVYVFSAGGDLMMTSDPTPSSGVFRAARRLSRREGPVRVEQVHDSGSSVLLARSDFVRNGEQAGSVIVSTDLGWLESTWRSLQWVILLAGTGALLVAGGMGLLLSRMIVRPLLEIRDIAGQLSRGDYGVRVPIRGKDELASLGESMNGLAESLAYYRSSRREFLSNVAHELRTPLTYVKGYAALLQETDPGEAKAKELIGIIRKQTGRLERLVGDLVTLSRLDEGALKLKKEPVDPRLRLRRLVEEMTPRAEELGVTLRLEVRGEGRLLADPVRFDQIVMNLLDNALRYSERGGQVKVTAVAEPDHGRIRLEVADEGVGMSREELERIWDRFYRVEKSRARRFGGTGLGLSIVRQLTKLHGGTIEVTSEPGRGTVFTLFFPLMESAQEGGDLR